MKKIINYLGLILGIVMVAVSLTACSDNDDNGSADVGLGIKVFFPTKVVTGQPMTINGSDLNNVTVVEFPGGVKVTEFEKVGNDMLRLTAPAGIAPEGGTITVRTENAEATSRLPLTLGHTKVSGYDKQPGEKLQGGNQLTVYGTDMEFINGVELLDEDGNPTVVADEDFVRKGTSNLVFYVPQDIFTGTFSGKLLTYDGQRIDMPEFAYEPAPTGHWETVKTSIWKNDGTHGAISWGGEYRFGMEGNDGNNECLATFSPDVWSKMKESTFYVTVRSTDPQIRLTTGWWSATWTGADIQPGNELLTDNGDGTYTLAVKLTGDPIVDMVDQQHMLFTGDRYTVEEIYFADQVWVENGSGPKQVTIWENDGSHGAISWGGDYRFALDGHDGNNECIATFPQDVWDKLKGGTFYLVLSGETPQIRITTGWWSATWTGADIQPGNERLTDNGDGTWTLEVNFDGDPVKDLLDEQHLLFTGGGFTPLKLYYNE
jgi:hypothetical protein